MEGTMSRKVWATLAARIAAARSKGSNPMSRRTGDGASIRAAKLLVLKPGLRPLHIPIIKPPTTDIARRLSTIFDRSIYAILINDFRYCRRAASTPGRKGGHGHRM
jgi:hypothetical protein